jgi:NADPH:quinone reductase-like Zn-dependent oxidoreductase
MCRQPTELRRAISVVTEEPPDLAVLKEMLESGKVKPAIDRQYTLAEVPEALQYLGQGHAQGRIVVTV